MRLRHFSLFLVIYCLSFQAMASNYLQFGRNNKLIYPERALTYDELNNAMTSDHNFFRRVQLLSRMADANNLSGRGDTMQRLHSSRFLAHRAAKDPAAAREYEQVMSSIFEDIKKFEKEHPEIINNLSKNDMFQAAAGNNPHLPEFCQNYPALGHDSFKSYMSGDNGASPNEAVFSCEQSDGGIFSVSVENLVDQYLDVEKFGYKNKVDDFKQKMMNESLLKVSSSRYQLYDIFDDLNVNNSSQKLRACVQNQGQSKNNAELATKFEQQEIDYRNSSSQMSPEDKSNRKTAYMRHLILNGLKAETVKAEMKHSNDYYDSLISAKNSRRDRAEINKLKEEKEAKFNSLQGQLNSMYQEHPTLFVIENNWTIFDWNNNELNTSPLQKSITGNSREAQEIVQGLRAATEREGSAGYEKFLTEHQDRIQKFFDSKIADPKFQAQVKESVEHEVNELNRSATHLCEKDGENLHHFPNLAQDVFMKVANEAPNQEAAKAEIMKHQSAYCYLMRNNPPRDSNFGIYDALGLGAIVAGLFVPGIGWATSAALLAAGSATLATQSAFRFVDARLTEKNSGALQKGGWESIDRYLQNRDQLGDATADLALESLIIFDGLALVNVIRRGVRGTQTLSTSVKMTHAKQLKVEAFIDSLKSSGLMTKLEKVMDVPGADPKLMGDFLSALSEADQRLVRSFLSKVDSNSWNLTDLHKIMDDAVKGFRQSCV